MSHHRPCPTIRPLPMLAAALIALAATTPLRAALTANITEILTTPVQALGDTYPAFIEVAYQQAENPFDLVILEATPGREYRVKQVITVTPDPNTPILAFHAGDWPDSATFTNVLPIPSPEPQFGLGFGAGLFSTARRLIIFDTTTNWLPNQQLSPQQTLEMSPYALESILLQLLVNGPAAVAPINGMTDTMTVSLGFGDAAIRLHQNGGYLDQFVTGPVNSDFQLLTGSPITPGFEPDEVSLPNETTTTSMPLPSSAVMGGVVLGFILLLRRGRPPHLRRPARSDHQPARGVPMLAA